MTEEREKERQEESLYEIEYTVAKFFHLSKERDSFVLVPQSKVDEVRGKKETKEKLMCTSK